MQRTTRMLAVIAATGLTNVVRSAAERCNTERQLTQTLHCLPQPRSHGVRVHTPSLSGHWSATNIQIFVMSILFRPDILSNSTTHMHPPSHGRCRQPCASSRIATTFLSPTTGSGGCVILTKRGSGRTSDPRSSVPVSSPPPFYTPLRTVPAPLARAGSCCAAATVVPSPRRLRHQRRHRYRHRCHHPRRRRCPCGCVKPG